MDPTKTKQLATSIVKALVDVGYEAYFAEDRVRQPPYGDCLL